MSLTTPNARELARGLVTREPANDRARQGLAGDAASLAKRACESAFRGLSRWIGPSGSHALLARALAEVKAEHLALATVRIAGGSNLSLEGVDESVEAHGAVQVAAGLEETLALVIDLLIGLIGADLTAQLLDQVTPTGASSDVPRENTAE